MSIDWGSVPDWVAGIGAVTALIFARAAVISARRTSDLQADQIEDLKGESVKRADAERRVFASKVTVYIGTERTEDAIRPAVRLVNLGDLPIYGLTIYCFTPFATYMRTYYVNGPRHDRRKMTTLTRKLTEILHNADVGELIGAGQLVAACSFRDSSGIWWYRTAQGALHEAKDSQAAAERAYQSGPTNAGPVEELIGSVP